MGVSSKYFRELWPVFETQSNRLQVLMPWIPNHKHKIEEKSTKNSQSSSKVVGLGLADCHSFLVLIVTKKYRECIIGSGMGVLEFKQCHSHLYLVAEVRISPLYHIEIISSNPIIQGLLKNLANPRFQAILLTSWLCCWFYCWCGFVEVLPDTFTNMD